MLAVCFLNYREYGYIIFVTAPLSFIRFSWYDTAEPGDTFIYSSPTPYSSESCPYATPFPVLPYRGSSRSVASYSLTHS